MSARYENANDEFLIGTLPSSAITTSANPFVTDVCWQGYNLEIAWTDLIPELERRDNPTHMIYRGAVKADSTVGITGTEFGDNFNSMSHQQLFFEITFPRDVILTMNIDAVDFAVSLTLLSHTLSSTALDLFQDDRRMQVLVVIQSHIVFPMRLDPSSMTAGTIATGMEIFNTDEVILTSDCDVLGSQGDSCVQEWQFTTVMEDPDLAECNIGGAYFLNFTMGCHSSANADDCFYVGEQGSAVLNLHSTNTCPNVVENSFDFSAVMQAYADANRTDTIYWSIDCGASILDSTQGETNVVGTDPGDVFYQIELTEPSTIVLSTCHPETNFNTVL